MSARREEGPEVELAWLLYCSSEQNAVKGFPNKEHVAYIIYGWSHTQHFHFQLRVPLHSRKRTGQGGRQRGRGGGGTSEVAELQ